MSICRYCCYPLLVLLLSIKSLHGEERLLGNSSVGSVQTIIFSGNIYYASGCSQCSDIATTTSLSNMGAGAECIFYDLTGIYNHNELTIKYGQNAKSNKLITLDRDGFQWQNIEYTSFYSPSSLPSARIDAIGPKYMDYIYDMTLSSIVYNNLPSLNYEWVYGDCQGDIANLPDISGSTTTAQFVYQNLNGPGTYQVYVSVKDPDNDLYSFTIEQEFEVLQGCSTVCNFIRWKMSTDPGECDQDFDCFSASTTSTDTGTKDTLSGTDPWGMSIVLDRHSLGGVDYTLNPSKWTGQVQPFACGGDLLYPTIAITQDTSSCMNSNTDFTFQATVTGNGWDKGVGGLDYGLTWQRPSGGGEYCGEEENSCTIPGSSALRSGKFWTYKLRVYLMCSHPFWKEVTFTPFKLSGDFTTTMNGTLQNITFEDSVVSGNGYVDCGDIINNPDLLGTGSACHFLTRTELQIEYGYGVTIGAQTLSFVTGGFTSCVIGNFERGSLPYISDLSASNTNRDAYQDHSIIYTMNIAGNVGDATYIYTWTYIDYPSVTSPRPSLAAATTSFIFNFWEMAPGTYQFRINMTDPANNRYYYHHDSQQLVVKESCTSSCDSITWKFEVDPGSCSCRNCFSNLNTVDTCDLQKASVSSHYEITLKYETESIGGNTISIYPSNWTNPRNNVDCGSEIKFPSIVLNENVPESCMNPDVDIVLSGTVTSNGLILGPTADYSISWIQPGTICADGISSCTIPSGSMTGGGPEIFKLQLKMNCQSSPVVWDEVEFTSFGFWPTFTPTTQGSVQTITFSDPVTPADGLNCNNIILDIGGLGTGTSCELSTSTTLLIKYGHDMPSGSFTLNFKPSGFLSCVQGSFTRANYPTFNLNSTSILDPSAYQDFVLTLFVADLVNEGSASLSYEWLIKEVPGGIFQTLNVAFTTETERIIKYSEMIIRNYTIKLIMTDPANTNFYFSRQYTGIEIKLSCQVDCDTIIWRFTEDPGSCADHCFVGYTSGDTYQITGPGSSSPFEIRMRYLPGSLGGADVKPDINIWSNHRNTSSCGSAIKFPKVTMNTDAPDCLAYDRSLTLSGHMTDNGLTLLTDYTITWIKPEDNLCNSNSDTCIIPRTALTTTGGPYQFILQLKLVCQAAPVVWSQVAFNEFDRSVPFTHATVGAIQTLTFSVSVRALGNDNCAALLQDTTKLGDGALCYLQNPSGGVTMKIKYGSSTVAGEQILNLNSDAFEPCVDSSDFSRAILPKFTIKETNLVTPGYQDNIATISLDDINLAGSITLYYEWEYLIYPTASIRPNLNDLPGTTDSVIFDYSEMSLGEYKVRVTMRDPQHSPFYYRENSTAFQILFSCTTNCENVMWLFSNNPGVRDGEGVIEDIPATEIFDSFGVTGTTPYKITLSYYPGSNGGVNWTLNPDHWSSNLHNVPCGEDVKFPSITMNQNANACQPSEEILTLSGTLDSNSLTPGTDFTMHWDTDGGGNICPNTSTSCTIPVNGLPRDVKYVFKLQLKMVCQTPKVWEQIVFNEFMYSSPLSGTLYGSVTIIIFPDDTMILGGGCGETILDDISVLGTGADCRMANPTTFKIKYGYDTTRNSPLVLSLNSSGFGPCRTGNFTRGDMPKYTLASGGTAAPAYADNKARLMMISIVNTGDAPLEYIWSYVSAPGEAKPDISTSSIGFSTTSYTFNYWEMAVGSYTVRVNMTDPDNSQFYYELTHSFEILNSCQATCNVVKWFFTHDPGSCMPSEESPCIRGVQGGDLYSLAITPGSNPRFTVKLSYLAGSSGPASLIPDTTYFSENFNHVDCGEELIFPTIELAGNAPLCQSPQIDLPLSGNVESRGNILTIDYYIYWIEGVDVVGENTLVYTIPTNGLVARGPYQYKAQIELACLPGVVWSEAVFTLFLYAPNFTESIQGSVQTLTFSTSIPAVWGENCTDLLVDIEDLGVGATCRLPTLTTMEIKYGFIGGPYTGSTIYFELYPANLCTKGKFERPNLPEFIFSLESGINPGYQDNTARVKVTETYEGSPNMYLEWSYTSTPTTTSLRPDLSSVTESEFDFNFWEMDRGLYTVKVKMLQDINPGFYYEQEIILHVDVNSCTTECDTITWLFTSDPGSCSSNCLTGFGDDDELSYSVSNIFPPYEVRATYQPGSPGGNNLNLIDSKYNNLHSGACGEILRYPIITIAHHPPECQSSEVDFTLYTNVVDKNLVLDTDYSLTWEEPDGYSLCTSAGDLCTISAGSLINGGPYRFKVFLRIICGAGYEPIWAFVLFDPFYYKTTQECLEACSVFGNAYYSHTEYICKDCDPRCLGCTGETNNLCIKCSNDPMVEVNIAGVCVCKSRFLWTYNAIIDRNNCEECHVHCNNCNGLTQFDCITCAEPRIYDSSTRSCICPTNMYILNDECESCSEECESCNGPGRENCLTCNIKGSYYPLSTNLTECLFLCQFPSPLFLRNDECLPCHPNCLACFGEEKTECNQCKPPYYLGNNADCIYTDCSHYPNTFPTTTLGELLCEHCLSVCDGCLDYPNYCLDCASGFYMLIETHSCLIYCPTKYYSYESISTCQACPEHCLVCERINFTNPYNISPDNFMCRECEGNYFLNTAKLCVQSGECGIKYYPEFTTRTCNLCNQACLGCTCSTNQCCLECQSNSYLTEIGSCELIICPIDEYLDENKKCQKCDKHCIGCIGPNQDNCLGCQPGFRPQFIDDSQVKCVPCEDITGYYTTENPLSKTKECREICGDGLNLGEYQCDDGNIIDGDGCSSKCTYEKGFKCTGGDSTHSDTCKDIIPPLSIAGIVDTQNLAFTFIFSKPVQILSSEEPKMFFVLQIIGTYQRYSFEYDVEFYKEEIKVVNSINTSNTLTDTSNTTHTFRSLQVNQETIDLYRSTVISLTPTSSFANNDKLRISFKSGILSDINGNLLEGTTHTISLTKFKYLDADDKEVVDSSGDAVMYSMIGLLSINIIIAIVCSSSMSLLFPLFNMIQLITILPLLQINLPENFRAFIREYLQFANLKFDFLFNPFHNWKVLDLSSVNSNPYNENFADNDLQSRALIVNYGTQLMIWTLVALSYIPIVIFSKCCGCKKLKEIKSAYEYAVLLTSFSEAFVEFSLLSFLNLFQLEFTSYSTSISSITGILGVILVSGYMVVVINIISRITDNLGSEDNLKKFGVLYQDTNYKNEEQRGNLPQYSIMVFLLRRFLYILTILLFYRTPFIQQCINISIHFFTFIYDIILKPYPISVLGILTIFFDLVLVVIFVSLPLYMIFEDQADQIGRIHIYILIATIALSWVIIACMSVRTIYLKFRRPTLEEKVGQIIAALKEENISLTPAMTPGTVMNTLSNVPRKKPVILIKKTNNFIFRGWRGNRGGQDNISFTIKRQNQIEKQI